MIMLPSKLFLLPRISIPNPFSLLFTYFFINHNPFLPSSYSASHAFDEMSQRNPHPQDAHFHSLLHHLKHNNARLNLVTTSICHCLALKIGALSHLPISTLLLTTYSKLGRIYLSRSRALFDEITNRDVIFWNAMITASIDSLCFTTPLNLFVQMTEDAVAFDSTTLLLVASALSHLQQLKQGQVLHGLSLKSGMLSDSALSNSMIDMYAKCGNLSSSECMFKEMEYRDIVSWNSIMSACLYNDHPKKTLWYLKKMAFSGQKADEVSLLCSLSASNSLRDLSSGQAIHGWGTKSGYNNVSVANSLISLYSECGDTRAVTSLFREMTYEYVIGNTCKASGRPNQMELTKFLITMVQLCAKLLLLRQGRAVHGFTIRQQLVADLSVTNSLLNMYSKCTSVRKAELLFNSILERDLASWNIMISGYSQNGHAGKAHKLFKELLHWCSDCSLPTLLSILPSCDSPQFLQLGKAIHSWQLKVGFSEDIVAINCLMDMYINCGELVATFSLLDGISQLVTDISSWNTVIVGCAKNDYFEDALRVFNSMRRKTNIKFDTITLVNIISACGNLKLVSEGKSVHGIAFKTVTGSNIRVHNSLITMYGRCGDIDSARSVFILCSDLNLCSWNCMISALSQNKDGKRALELFRCLEYEPNEITLATILSACTQIGHGKQIHGYAFRMGFHTNSFISAALLDMYSNSGRLDIACQVFQSRTEKSIAAWNSMIASYGFHGKGTRSIQVFHKMCDSGMRPTKSTFISILSACSHSGLIEEGLYYYKQMMVEYGVEPATEHHVCVVDMLGRSGKLDDAYEFIKGMKRRPEAGVWGALLSACNYHGAVEMGREVAEIVFEMEPQNAGYYIALSNMYIAAGSWRDAVELRGITQNQRLRKPPAYSLLHNETF
ncbi:hypothetical protein UlMin_042310 [Ulmus minor]